MPKEKIAIEEKEQIKINEVCTLIFFYFVKYSMNKAYNIIYFAYHIILQPSM